MALILIAIANMMYFGFIVHRWVAAAAESITYQRSIGIQYYLNRLACVSFQAFVTFVNSFMTYKRDTISLLIRQNDPEFNENVKTFIGDIMGLDNTSEYVDLSKIQYMDFAWWRSRYRRSVMKLQFKLARSRFAAFNRFIHLMELARRNALIIKASIAPSVVIKSTITYIHHNGGLVNYA